MLKSMTAALGPRFSASMHTRKPPVAVTRSSLVTSMIYRALRGCPRVRAASRPPNMAHRLTGGARSSAKKIIVLSVDHQNKPDMAPRSFANGPIRMALNMLLGGSNRREHCHGKVAAAKKVPFFACRRGRASLTGAGCTPPFDTLRVYDTTRAGQRHGECDHQARRQDLVLRDRRLRLGTQLQEAAARVVTANGGKVLGAGARPWARPITRRFFCKRRRAGAQVLGLANAGTDFSNSLKGANEFGISKDDETGGVAGLQSRHPQPDAADRAGSVPNHGVVLDLNDETRAFAKRFFAKMHKEPTMTQAALLFGHAAIPKGSQGGGSTDPDLIMAQLKKTKINDMFYQGWLHSR